MPNFILVCIANFLPDKKQQQGVKISIERKCDFVCSINNYTLISFLSMFLFNTTFEAKVVTTWVLTVLKGLHGDAKDSFLDCNI